MSKSIAGKLKIDSFAEYIDGEDIVINEIPLEELHEFKGHPFRVLDDEKMAETVESIKAYGVLMPGIVRKRSEGGYEIISGHRRKHACELAGLKTMPVIIREYTDDEAVVAMVDSNIQREEILPSEKAHAYSMKYEAWKHQGREGGHTLDEIGEAAGESGKTVQRYIWLSNLSDNLLGLVDDKTITIRVGIEISFLTQKEQAWVEELIEEDDVRISDEQAKKIKDYSKEKELTKALLSEILLAEKAKPRRFVMKNDIISKYFSAETSIEEVEKTVFMLLEEWKNRNQLLDTVSKS